jgi:hypothetical protein
VRRQTIKNNAVLAPGIERLIVTLRGERLLLDADLARIYGVPTHRFNEAVKRNLDRFPPDFMFRLLQEEWKSIEVLRSQIAILKTGRGAHRKYLPNAFTEHGALMAANILNSPRAIAMSLYVIRAFVKLRADLAANAIFKRLAEIDKTLLVHDTALRDIFQKLRPLLEPPTAPPKPEIGFHVKEDIVPYRTRSSRIKHE